MYDVTFPISWEKMMFFVVLVHYDKITGSETVAFSTALKGVFSILHSQTFRWHMYWSWHWSNVTMKVFKSWLRLNAPTYEVEIKSQYWVEASQNTTSTRNLKLDMHSVDISNINQVLITCHSQIFTDQWSQTHAHCFRRSCARTSGAPKLPLMHKGKVWAVDNRCSSGGDRKFAFVVNIIV